VLHVFMPHKIPKSIRGVTDLATLLEGTENGRFKGATLYTAIAG